MTQLPPSFAIDQQQFQEALLVNGKFGAKCNYLAPVLHLGQHYHYKNQNLWLRLDLENIAEQAFVIRKKAGENELLLPMKPRYLEKITPERQQLAHQNKTWLRENPQALMAICSHHRQYTYPKVPNIDADAALYEIGFANREEENLWQKFHLSSPAKKMQVANQFPNRVRQEQALRIMGRHFFNDLTPNQKIMFNEYLEKATRTTADQAPIDFRGQHKLTISTALTEIQTLLNSSLTTEQQTLLAELNCHYSSI